MYNIEKVKKDLKIGNNFEVWYVDEERYIFELIEGEGKLNVEEIEFDLSSEEDEVVKKDGNLVYVLKYPKRIQIIFTFIGSDRKLSENEIETIKTAYGPIYLNRTIDILERDKTVILETVKSISEPLDLNEVLDNILKGALKILTNMDSGYIQLIDKKNDCLVVKSSIGFKNSIFDFKPMIGESIPGAVSKDGKSRYYNSRKEIIERLTENHTSEKNIEILEKSIEDANLLGGLISVPIIYQKEIIGVMTVHKFNEDKKITEQDVTLLESFASKAAISIDNTRLFEDLSGKIEELKNMNGVMSLKNKIYKDLTKLSLMDKGVEEMVTSLSKMTEVPLILYNKIKNEIQFNNMDNEETDEELLSIIAEYEKIDIGLSQGEYNDSYFYPIKNGNIFLGYLITHSSISDDYITRLIVEEGILVLTLELMKNYVLDDVIYKRTHEYFTKLLKSTDRREVENYRQRLGLPVNENYIAIVGSIDDYTDLQVLEMNTHNLIAALKKEFDENGYEYLVYGFHNKVNLIIHSVEKIDSQDILDRLKHVIDKFKENRQMDISMGIGSLYKGVDNISKTYKEAELALSYISPQKDKYLIEYKDIGINRLFINHLPGDMSQFLEDVLGELYTDEGVKSNLDETLFTYIDNNKSAVETAEALHIHINTFYNRLKRIEKMLDVDFDDPEDNLKIQLACHLKKNEENIPM